MDGSRRRNGSHWKTTAPIALAAVLFLPAALSTESMTLTTFYPAPYGVYTQLRSTRNTFLAYQGDRVGIGTVTPGSKLGINGEVAVGSAYSANAAPSGGMIVQGLVGLGTNAPDSGAALSPAKDFKLHVQGDALTTGEAHVRKYVRLPNTAVCSPRNVTSGGWTMCNGNEYASVVAGVYAEGYSYVPTTTVGIWDALCSCYLPAYTVSIGQFLCCDK